MATVPAPQPDKSITHIYVRDAQKAFVRPCWQSAEGLYCGMCMRSTIEPVIGAVCPVCSATVERVLELVQGGAPRFLKQTGQSLIRVGGEKQKKQQGILLDFLISREAGA